MNLLEQVQTQDMIRGLEHLYCGDRLRAEVVQPGERKVSRRPLGSFQHLKGLEKDTGQGHVQTGQDSAEKIHILLMVRVSELDTALQKNIMLPKAYNEKMGTFILQ
ncbi:hypothetical protein TURU_107578 [Turdus rufiventris]|nr:hypothetical protein TURU_107578 [Turdus rufiventris]